MTGVFGSTCSITPNFTSFSNSALILSSQFIGIGEALVTATGEAFSSIRTLQAVNYPLMAVFASHIHKCRAYVGLKNPLLYFLGYFLQLVHMANFQEMEKVTF